MAIMDNIAIGIPIGYGTGIHILSVTRNGIWVFLPFEELTEHRLVIVTSWPRPMEVCRVVHLFLPWVLIFSTISQATKSWNSHYRIINNHVVYFFLSVQCVVNKHFYSVSSSCLRCHHTLFLQLFMHLSIFLKRFSCIWSSCIVLCHHFHLS